MQLVDVLDAVHGVRPPNMVWTPANAQWILVLLQDASLSVLPMEFVVSTTIATLYCALIAPLMAAVEAVRSVRELAELMPNIVRTRMKIVGITAVWTTWIALLPIGAALHTIPSAVRVARHFGVIATVVFGRFEFWFAPPAAELYWVTAAFTDAWDEVDSDISNAPAIAAASVEV